MVVFPAVDFPAMLSCFSAQIQVRQTLFQPSWCFTSCNTASSAPCVSPFIEATCIYITPLSSVSLSWHASRSSCTCICYGFSTMKSFCVKFKFFPNPPRWSISCMFLLSGLRFWADVNYSCSH